MLSRATEFSDLISRKAKGCQILARVGVFERMQDGDWTAAGGGFTDVWKAVIEQRLDIHNFRTITSVTVSEAAASEPVATALVLQTSIQDVEDNLGSFYFDTATTTLYVSIDTGVDPNDYFAFIGFTLCFSTGDPYSSGRTFINNDTIEVYKPIICVAPSAEKEIGDPFIGSISTGQSVLGLDGSNGELDQIWALYIWDYGTVVVLLGGDDLPLGEYATVFVGSVTTRTWSDGSGYLQLVDACDPLLQTISGADFVAADLTNVTAYTGNGTRGFGDASNAISNTNSFSVAANGGNINAAGAMSPVITAGQPKPIVYGALKGFAPPVVGMNITATTAQTAIVCLSDSAYKAITQVYVGGKTQGVSWWTSYSTGMLAVMLTLGVAGAARSIADGISVDFESTELSAGVLMTNPADIVKHMCTTVRASAGAGVTGVVITSADATTQKSYASLAGSQPFPDPVNAATAKVTGAISGGSMNAAYVIDYTSPTPNVTVQFNWTSTPIPIGSIRPIAYGTQTNFNPQYWAQALSQSVEFEVVGPNPIYTVHFLLVCLGSTYVSVSAVRVWNGSSWTASNVSWLTSTSSGLLFVMVSGATPGAAPVGSLIQVDFEGPPEPDTPAPVGPTVPTGPLLQLDEAILAASNTLCANYSIALSILQPTVMRDILIKIARDTLSYVYVTNTGLVAFDTYTPSTTGEVEVSEDTGFWLDSPEVEESAQRCYRKVYVEYDKNPNRDLQVGGEFLVVGHTVANSIGLLSGSGIDFYVNESLHATSASATKLATRMAKLTSRGAPVHKFRAPISAMALDLADKVEASRTRLPVAVPGDPVHAYVTYMMWDLQELEVTIEMTENRISDLAGGW